MRSKWTFGRLFLVVIVAVSSLSFSWVTSFPSKASTMALAAKPDATIQHQPESASTEYLELSFPTERRVAYTSHVDHSVPGGFYGLHGNDSIFTAFYCYQYCFSQQYTPPRYRYRYPLPAQFQRSCTWLPVLPGHSLPGLHWHRQRLP